MIENTTFYYYLLDKYKIELQTVLMIEETSEYIQSAMKVKRFGYSWFYKIVEEFADVVMSFNSLRVFHNEPDYLDDSLKNISKINGSDNDDIYTFGEVCLWISNYLYKQHIMENNEYTPLFNKDKNILYKDTTILAFKYYELIIKIHSLKRVYDLKTNDRFSKAVDMRIHDKINYLMNPENVEKPKMREDWETWVDNEYGVGKYSSLIN